MGSSGVIVLEGDKGCDLTMIGFVFPLSNRLVGFNPRSTTEAG